MEWILRDHPIARKRAEKDSTVTSTGSSSKASDLLKSRWAVADTKNADRLSNSSILPAPLTKLALEADTLSWAPAYEHNIKSLQRLRGSDATTTPKTPSKLLRPTAKDFTPSERHTPVLESTAASEPSKNINTSQKAPKSSYDSDLLIDLSTPPETSPSPKPVSMRRAEGASPTFDLESAPKPNSVITKHAKSSSSTSTAGEMAALVETFANAWKPNNISKESGDEDLGRASLVPPRPDSEKKALAIEPQGSVGTESAHISEEVPHLIPNTQIKGRPSILPEAPSSEAAEIDKTATQGKSTAQGGGSPARSPIAKSKQPLTEVQQSPHKATTMEAPCSAHNTKAEKLTHRGSESEAPKTTLTSTTTTTKNLPTPSSGLRPGPGSKVNTTLRISESTQPNTQFQQSLSGYTAHAERQEFLSSLKTNLLALRTPKLHPSPFQSNTLLAVTSTIYICPCVHALIHAAIKSAAGTSIPPVGPRIWVLYHPNVDGSFAAVKMMLEKEFGAQNITTEQAKFNTGKTRILFMEQQLWEPTMGLSMSKAQKKLAKVNGVKVGSGTIVDLVIWTDGAQMTQGRLSELFIEGKDSVAGGFDVVMVPREQKKAWKRIRGMLQHGVDGLRSNIAKMERETGL